MRFTIFAALAAVMLGLWSGPASAATLEFKTWLRDLRTEAAQRGVSPETISRALPDTLAPIPRILELDRKQPEGTTSFDDYLDKAVNPDRIQKGRAKMAYFRKTLQRVEEAYGVDKQVIVALWGIETSYGTNTGGFDVVNALATLAYDGRRSEYFRDELFKALRILDEEHISHSKMKGSWAGAMGQSQFMPSSFLKFAVDFNKDGKRDIWTTEADVFASAANYLAESGWKKGAIWGRQVRVPHSLDRSLLGVNTTQTIQQWHDKGIRLANGKPVPFEGEYMASVVQPSGPGTTAFLVYDNYRVLLKWNKSSYFASAVSTLAERLK